ncbi:MAG: hypothetical protein IJY42_03985 [Clostridia bacterium]|nr:hypothetical protein [Clostridia bacterium]
MMFKKTYRPAYASATADCPRTSRDDRFSSATFSAGEADDVNAFGFSAQQRPQRPQQERRSAPNNRPPRFKGSGFSHREKRLFVIGIAAVVVLLALIISIIVAVATADRSIKKENNAFVAYAHGDTYAVSANGKVFNSFDGSVEVRPAADNSFAYVTEDRPDGYRVYLLEGKKLEPMTDSTVTKVLAYADYKPGIVYESEGGKINICTEKIGEDRITSQVGVGEFVISGDATTVAYVEPSAGNENRTNVMIYRYGHEPTKLCQYQYGSIAGLSLDGTYAYVNIRVGSGEYRLHYCDTTSDEIEKIVMGTEGNFGAIVATNVSGEEVIYTTVDGTDVVTYLYSMKRKNKEDSVNPAVKIGKGLYSLTGPKTNIACYETFKGAYLQGTTGLSLSVSGADVTYNTCRIGKNYDKEDIASAKGLFSPDEKYFYFVAGEENTLYQIELKDKKLNRNTITTKVKDFVLTQKGNLYILNDEQTLYFRKASNNASKDPIAYDVAEMELFFGGNTLYFQQIDSDIVYSTKEGSDESIVKFDSYQLTVLPFFTDASVKKTYTFVSDDAEGWCLYYTSNGKSFKRIQVNCDDPTM